MSRKITAFIVSSALCFATFSAFANTKVLANYNDLLQALDTGNKVHGVIHLDKCKLVNGGGLTSISVGFNFDYYNHYNIPIDGNQTKEGIATSKTIFSITKIQELGPVENYIQLHIFTDNSVELFGSILDPLTYKQLITVQYACAISSDPNQGGMMLYMN